MESAWEHKNKYLFISNCMFVDLCFLLLFLQPVKTRPYDTAINMSKLDFCVTELIFTLVQWQMYAQWISSKTLTRRRNYETGWFRETKNLHFIEIEVYIYIKFVTSSPTLHKTHKRKHFWNFDPFGYTNISVRLLSPKHIKNRDKVLSITAGLPIRSACPVRNM